jgi:AraC family transcriptional regulator, transcriptional activator of pobA
MPKQLYPTFTIKHLEASKSKNDLLNADRFKEYLSKNPHLQVVHKHSFYHLVYFTQGGGEHLIDFKTFKVQKGMIYFMQPGQVHNWHFKGVVDGYIINFSPTFFDSHFINSNIVDQFPFFGGNLTNQVIYFRKAAQKNIEAIFQNIITEQKENKPSAQLMTAGLLIQLFLTVHREILVMDPPDTIGHQQAPVIKKFQLLLESRFREIKLPKQYASLLYVTPHHLNALCKKFLHMSAGEVIRNRIVLEAKRLLVNVELSISAIALELDFADTSYFVKFFKKHTGSTPEAFRQEHYKE